MATPITPSLLVPVAPDALGGDLVLRAGQELIARVLSVGPQGVRLAVGGTILMAQPAAGWHAPAGGQVLLRVEVPEGAAGALKLVQVPMTGSVLTPVDALALTDSSHGPAQRALAQSGLRGDPVLAAGLERLVAMASEHPEGGASAPAAPLLRAGAELMARGMPLLAPILRELAQAFAPTMTGSPPGGATPLAAFTAEALAATMRPALPQANLAGLAALSQQAAEAPIQHPPVAISAEATSGTPLPPPMLNRAALARIVHQLSQTLAQAGPQQDEASSPPAAVISEGGDAAPTARPASTGAPATRLGSPAPAAVVAGAAVTHSESPSVPMAPAEVAPTALASTQGSSRSVPLALVEALTRLAHTALTPAAVAGQADPPAAVQIPLSPNPAVSMQMLARMLGDLDIQQLTSAFNGADERQLAADVIGLLRAAAPALDAPAKRELHHQLAQLVDDAASPASMDLALPAVSPTASQILSLPRVGEDPGYAWLHLKLADGQRAEILVHRDPQQGHIDPKRFSLVFLLETANIGHVMIHVDATESVLSVQVSSDTLQGAASLQESVSALRTILQTDSSRMLRVEASTKPRSQTPTTLLPAAFPPEEHVYYA